MRSPVCWEWVWLDTLGGKFSMIGGNHNRIIPLCRVRRRRDICAALGGGEGRDPIRATDGHHDRRTNQDSK